MASDITLLGEGTVLEVVIRNPRWRKCLLFINKYASSYCTIGKERSQGGGGERMNKPTLGKD